MKLIDGREDVGKSDRQGVIGILHANQVPMISGRGRSTGFLSDLATTTAGLSTSEAQSRLLTYGPKRCGNRQAHAALAAFLTRFRNPLVIILLVASGLSAATGDVASFVIIFGIVMLSMTLDFVQEVRAQNAVEALRKSVAVQATVRRDGARCRCRWTDWSPATLSN
jgi:magnesium-transporting ATPase (P-type)